ncbi:phenylalanine--tRNA ligase subunit beta [Terrihabitans rhizophilus]|uniref:Phenylalanine--tRNA ligase beta subunit n=1 Tax=Terrihabitans rhizophilus TaxID=3092662 RepID=A0ABU4RMX7_9HYPH|nr:phenylalanine--tRNA ligase subunit beta [Terrihabitans sp. PJ23]MDX6805020.1 phenylalanine--tRNA ligase subunit beta [Terrihabitans sp. PJ23]
MKFTISWLKEHLDTAASTTEIADALTRVGLEVEHVEDRAAALAPFKTARVVEAVQHPNADKLRVCKVDPGDGNLLQVVCGAPNARTGIIAVLAREGAVIPDTGTVLKPGEIRGQASQGMMVSEREMGLSNEHNGIIEMPEGTPIGVPFAPLMGLDDPVIEIAVTPNRPDCLGVSGIARDLAAAGLGALTTPETVAVEGRGEVGIGLTLDLDDPELCPAFALRRIRGVRNGPSPDWLQKRLRAIGLRPINALVDITNLLTFDRNRPLHVFDAVKVAGDLVVRRARGGESLTALDGKTYDLDTEVVVIADENGVESMAGVMGGEATGCDEGTTDVLLESALWSPLNIAQTGRRLGVHSDARHRFERGVDPAFTVPGVELATRLILDLCGGEASEILLVGEIPDGRVPIRFPTSEVERLTGLSVSADEIAGVLDRLGFARMAHDDVLSITPPTWRPDVHGKADLVEEVVRIVGLDRVKSVPLPRAEGISRPVLTALQRRSRTARRLLAARGLVEAVTWSFVPKAHAEAFGGGKPELALANPIAVDLSDMRPSLLPGLLAGAQRNANRGLEDAALFEVGQIFLGAGPGDQRMAAAVLRRGTAKPSGSGRHWSSRAASVHVFDAKADALGLLAALGLPADRVQIVPGAAAYFHPGRSGTLQLGPKNVFGYFGELHPRVLKTLDVEGPVVAIEIVLDALPEPKAKATKAKPPLERLDLQAVSRDFAFVVKRDVKAADVLRAVQGADRKLIAGAEVFDVYEGTGVSEGMKSLAVAVTLQPRDKTMTDAEIEAVAGAIVAAVTKATGAVLRG